MWGRPAQPGDWVSATTKISTGLLDDLTGGGLPAGSRGVVTDRSGRWLTVEFDNGPGTTTARVKDSHCHIARRGGGRDRFHDRTRRMSIVRLALAAFLLWPFAQFFALYLWYNRTLDGIMPALALATLESVGDFAAQIVTEPVRTLLYLGFLAVLGRLAFRR
ncbi:hypothetical protein [Nocardioides daphniae]|uniref:Uncharacterized protein n=1 Tax=Nocardioides daphniae TaxID=402297 RepID=A0A4P7UEQ8_9ACTN|nr:hypothetical protein [Nocardioides daphniae]QCC77399.1 hypothetical protein E2C04_09785 [Nocardioides daphniae]GGD24606.1 hypothetical protein GCM10007231_24740 [Nocardioides daphniae]